LCLSLTISGQLPAPTVNVFVNGGGDSWIYNFEELVTLAFALDRVMLHTVVHHSSHSTYVPNFTEIKETFCRRMDDVGRM